MQYTNVDDREYTTVATELFPPTTTIPIAQEMSIDASVVTDGSKSIDNMKHTDVIGVLLVDDHALMREGLRQLFTLEEDIQVVGEAVDGIDALQKIRQLRPDVVLMDIRMPVVNGIVVTQQVAQEFPEIAVLMLTMHQQSQQILQAMKSGARGYLLKTASAHEVAEAIRTVHSSGVFVPPEMTGLIIKEYRRLSEVSSDLQSIEMLQAKEVEIVRYVAMGMSNREIAEKLSYSEKTVKNYLSTIFQKLHLRDRTQVAIFALKQGLLADET